jgi:hypothetical protein
MPEPITRERVQALHAWYCQALRVDRPITPGAEYAWFQWLRSGYNGPQLQRVLRYLLREIRADRRNPGAIKLSHLLDPEQFAEDLAIAQINWQTRATMPPLPGEVPAQPKPQPGPVPPSAIRHPQSGEERAASARALDHLRKSRETL